MCGNDYHKMGSLTVYQNIYASILKQSAMKSRDK